MRFSLFLLLAIIYLTGCNSGGDKLPVLGFKTTEVREVNGQQVIDSVDYTVPGFTFIDQDSNTVNAATLQNKIYVADFFFTSCPSICPKMMKEMLRVSDKYKNDNRIVLLSFSIDPARDTVARLKEYCGKLGIVDSKQWHLLTGNKDSIYSLAKQYLVSAAEDPDAPGGHIHSGNFILIDTQKRIRGYYDGTKEESVTKLMKDMDLLLNEK